MEFSSISTAIKTIKSLKSATDFVLLKCSERRQKHFFESLLQNLQIEQASGEESEDVTEALNELINNDQISELIFDAYRRVCFSKTRKYGPKVIALLTAELLNNALTSEDEEEVIFEAAERLGDLDFVRFHENYAELVEKADSQPEGYEVVKVHRSGDEIIAVHDLESFEVGSHKNSESELTPPKLREFMGNWAHILEDSGAIRMEYRQFTDQVPEDSERNIHYDMTIVRNVMTIVYHSSARRLFDIYVRARK